eukprot:CAMPEP_0175143994 /NCGR_PEP_ID=MMETSP0087-20121206/13831_1 /TAXON_ID=136419 /ORGANISM="Unknown Unknown, Strain D1" /LENGTH=541 /DNA_ID=CAMNT_0016428305 /DNA_START=97 /DNA_END=1722 /DNA_ORIENTATION=+
MANEHGSVFALGEHIDVDLISYMMVGLIVFTIMFEVGIHKLEHYLQGNPVHMEALAKVFKELTILGFISFILLLIHEFIHIPFHVHLVFEFAHVWIFFVALVFIVHAIIFMASLGSAEKKFKSWDATRHDHNPVMSVPGAKDALLGSPDDAASLQYHVAKEIFRTHHKLKPSFDFRKYLASFCAETITELLDTSELTWFLIIIMILLNLGRNHLVDYMTGEHTDPAKELAAADASQEHHQEAVAGAAKAAPAKAMFVATNHILTMTTQEFQSVFATHQRSLWTFMIFGWVILAWNFVSLACMRFITNKMLFAGRISVGRDPEEEPLSQDPENPDDEESMREFLPCGSTKVFSVLLEFTVMIQCFYLGLLCILNGRAAYNHFAPPYGLLFLLVMFVPIAFNMFVCFPAQLKALAFLSAIAETNEHLKHEVIEFQEAMNIDFHHKMKKFLAESGKSVEQMSSEIFEAISVEEDGERCVTYNRLYSYLHKAGIAFKKDQFFTVFKQIDIDDGGTVDLQELREMLSASESEEGVVEKKAGGHGHH